MQTSDTRTRLGEVIETSSHKLVCQSHVLFQAPALGSIVYTSSPEVYAVVATVSTSPIDPGRRILARGGEDLTEEDIERQNPQLKRLLITTFEAVVVGHKIGDAVLHELPPVPPRVYAAVYQCSPEQVRQFTSSTDLLNTLLRSETPNADQVITACLRWASRFQPDTNAFLVSAGKRLAQELAGDTPRLNTLLRRLF